MRVEDARYGQRVIVVSGYFKGQRGVLDDVGITNRKTGQPLGFSVKLDDGNFIAGILATDMEPEA